MNHTFVGSLIEPTQCRVCKRPIFAHGKTECESCGAQNQDCDIIEGDILACKQCQERDKEIKAEVKQYGNTHTEITNNVKNIMALNKGVEEGLKIVTDIFNAKTVAIKELKIAIDNDPEIPADQKDFKLAKVLSDRYYRLKDILIEKKTEIIELENEQRAIHQHYNQLAKQLKDNEKEQIRLKDLTYQPNEPKVIKKPKSITTKAVDKQAVLEFVKKLETEFPGMKGQGAVLIQATMVAQSTKSPEAAYNIVKGMLEQRN